MATATRPAEPAPSFRVEPYRFTVAQFLRMARAGVFPDHERIELLGGVPVRKMTRYPPHNFAVGRLSKRLDRLVAPAFLVRDEKPTELGRYWRPEPDIVIARGPDDNYRHRDPRPRDIVLIAEVAESSYAKDRGIGWVRFAGCRIPVYWIVHLPRRQVEVYSQPAGRGKAARYEQCEVYGPDAAVPVVIDGAEVGRVAVADLLP